MLCKKFVFFFFFLWLKKSFIYQRTKNQTIETSSQRTRVKSATSTPCPVSMLKVTVAKQKTKLNSPTLEPIKQVSVVWHHFQAVIESSVLWWEYYLQFIKRNREKKKKKKINKRSLISVCLKNSAWNEWLDVKLCTYLYLFAFIYIWFFTLLISHIDHIKYSKYVCCSKKKKGNQFEWHVTTCVSHFNIKHLTIILIPIVMTLFEQ